MPKKELQDKVVSKSKLLEEVNPRTNSQNDEEDLLYTHKPENRGVACMNLLFAEDLAIEITVEKYLKLLIGGN